MTMSLIETVEVGSGGAASIEFTSIPQDGTDLVLKVSARTDGTGGIDWLYIQFNGETATTNYSGKELYGTGSSAGSQNTTQKAGIISDAGTTANTFSSTSIYISNYAGSSAKSFSVDSVTENNDTAGYQVIDAQLWDNTDAITSIKLIEGLESANFLQYTTASLYKITAA